MDETQFNSLKDKVETGEKPRIHLQARDYLPNAYSFASGDSKTLLYGYDCDRNTHHVFQDALGFIYLYVYKKLTLGGVKDLVKIDVSGDGIASLDDLIPNKRLYPQYCDYDFCAYLKGKGVDLPFTTWADPVKDPKNVFAGEIF